MHYHSHERAQGCPPPPIRARTNHSICAKLPRNFFGGVVGMIVDMIDKVLAIL